MPNQKLSDPKHAPDKEGFWVRNRNDFTGSTFFIVYSNGKLWSASNIFFPNDWEHVKKALKETMMESLSESTPCWFYMPGYNAEELDAPNAKER